MMTNTQRKLAALNDRQRAAIANTAVGYMACAMIPGIMGLAFLVGLNIPMPDTAARYDVVLFQGNESDIVDYDVSFSDCLAIVEFSRSNGSDMTCEVAR